MRSGRPDRPSAIEHRSLNVADGLSRRPDLMLGCMSVLKLGADLHGRILAGY
jgi:hypothetical protein